MASVQSPDADVSKANYVFVELKSTERAELGGRLRELALRHLAGKNDPLSQLANFERSLGLDAPREVEVAEGQKVQVGISDNAMRALLPEVQAAAATAGRPVGTSELQQLFFVTSSTRDYTVEAVSRVFGVPAESLGLPTKK
ncbi:MAG: hypothetical protein J0M12_08910 [Deltaproteobacteria bacterium]|nr:hypothetical protein [Deltaproteobacteria bacterium]